MNEFLIVSACVGPWLMAGVGFVRLWRELSALADHQARQGEREVAASQFAYIAGRMA